MTKTKIKAAECHKCGECCSRLIIEFDMHDLLREPKLRPYFPELKGRDEWELVGVLPSPCPFLTSNNKCSIYPISPLMIRCYIKK